MRYDLAVWEGDRPDDDEAALAEYQALMDRFEAGGLGDPTPRIRAYVEGLLARWPDIDVSEASPWASSPLMGEAAGPIVYFPMVVRRADEACAFAASLAREHGLVCFDPQSESLV